MKQFHFALVFAALLVLGASCKPKQSAYKQVYEAAKERDATICLTAYHRSKRRRFFTTGRSIGKKGKSRSSLSYRCCRVEKIQRGYCLLSVKLNAESLKSRMENEGHNVILAQNEQGMYRVIVASYDDRDQAAARRDEIYRTYSAKGDTEYLRRTYGVPFNDLWILERQF